MPKKININNSVTNSPFKEPKQHFKFNARGITEEIAEGRRRSEYFMPFLKPKKQSAEAQNTIRFWQRLQAKICC